MREIEIARKRGGNRVFLKERDINRKREECVRGGKERRGIVRDKERDI